MAETMLQVELLELSLSKKSRWIGPLLPKKKSYQLMDASFILRNDVLWIEKVLIITYNILYLISWFVFIYVTEKNMRLFI